MIPKNVLKVPKSASDANIKYHSVVAAGLMVFYVVMYVSWKFYLQPNEMQIKLFFYAYLAFIVPIKCLFSIKAKKATQKLRSNFSESTPSDIGIEAPLGANSLDPKVQRETSDYWMWNLFVAFFSGTTLAWMFGLFFVFLE